MKILQILPELNMGGVERGTLDLARQLIRRGHQALVISGGGTLVKELESIGARHFCLPVQRKSLFSILVNIPKVSRIICQENIDIVHARSRVPALIAFLACRRSGTVFMSTCHGYYSQNFFSRVMGWGKRVIVASEAIRRHMVEDFAVPEERIRLIARGVNLDEFKFSARPQSKDPRPKVFTIGVIGRLTPLKGHRYFLLALAKVIRVLPRVKALIVGDISPGKEKYREELLILTRRLGLDRYVEFWGRENNITNVFGQLDVLVMPSVAQEAFGRVLIEAGACGIPVIASNVGGVVDIIQDGVNGLLVTPRSPTDLAQAIIRLFKEPELASMLVWAARKNVEQNFTLDQMAEKTIEVYKEVQKSLKILVIKLSALGDVILIGPSLGALRRKFPQAHIAVLVAEPYQAVLKNCPYIDQILTVPLKAIKAYKALWHLSGLLRRLDFDIIVDLQNNRSSHLLAYLSSCNRRYGYDNGKFSFLLNRKIRDSKVPLPPVEHQARALQMLDIQSVEGALELWPNEHERVWADDFLQQHRKDNSAPLIGINLGASPGWFTKRWAIEQVAGLLDKIKEAAMEVVLTGKAQDKKLVNRLSQLTRSPFIDAVGLTEIMQLACLIQRCNVYITTDSAPLHIAYAVKTSVVALFGPTDPRRHTVPGPKQVTINKTLACSPCYRRRCRVHNCMNEISPEDVFKAVRCLS